MKAGSTIFLPYSAQAPISIQSQNDVFWAFSLRPYLTAYLRGLTAGAKPISNIACTTIQLQTFPSDYTCSLAILIRGGDLLYFLNLWVKFDKESTGDGLQA